MTSYTYSFLDFQCAISGPGGSFSLGSSAGVAEEGITFEPAEDKNTRVVGADGTPMNVLHAGTPGTITVRLLKTSATNKMLMDLYNFQRTSSVNWGQNVITGADVARGDNHVGRACAFKRAPTVVYSKEGPMNEWVFDAGRLHMQLGSGSPSL